MAWNDTQKPGRIGWMDLTVEDAPAVRDFYAAVAGWEPHEVPVDDYHDFSMGVAGGEDITGICHRKGQNAGIPPQWVPYIVVTDLASAFAEATKRGATAIVEPKVMEGAGTYALLRGLAGETFALWEDAKE